MLDLTYFKVRILQVEGTNQIPTCEKPSSILKPPALPPPSTTSIGRGFSHILTQADADCSALISRSRVRPYGLTYVGRTYQTSLTSTLGLPRCGLGWEIVRRLSTWYKPCQLDTEIDEAHSRPQDRSQVQAASPRTGQTQSSTQNQNSRTFRWPPDRRGHRSEAVVTILHQLVASYRRGGTSETTSSVGRQPLLHVISLNLCVLRFALTHQPRLISLPSPMLKAVESSNGRYRWTLRTPPQPFFTITTIDLSSWLCCAAIRRQWQSAPCL